MTSTVRKPCPQCDRGPRDTALAVTTDERGEVQFCHRCRFTSAKNNVVMLAAPAPMKSSGLRWSERAEALWRRAAPLQGTLAQRYLLGRGCLSPPIDGDVRFLPATDKHPAAMVARITDAVTNDSLSLHFTRLNPDASKIDKRLLAGHVKRGGVIRLWPDSAVTQGIALAEGIETALSAAHLFTPIWAAVDAGNLALFPVLAGITSITVFADNDPVGVSSARQCGKRWKDAGREVRIRAPRRPCDINDLVRGVA